MLPAGWVCDNQFCWRTDLAVPTRPIRDPQFRCANRAAARQICRDALDCALPNRQSGAPAGPVVVSCQGDQRPVAVLFGTGFLPGTNEADGLGERIVAWVFRNRDVG
jgi:hypothetical protein